jgi:hypothetical protein
MSSRVKAAFVTSVAADAAICCIALATCGDMDGVGPDSSPVWKTKTVGRDSWRTLRRHHPPVVGLCESFRTGAY